MNIYMDMDMNEEKIFNDGTNDKDNDTRMADMSIEERNKKVK